MTERIENQFIAVSVASAGAELSGIFHKERKQEFLWQGSAEWWPRRAPVLFPIVGKLNQNTFRVNGKEYSLPQHGFARDSEFELKAKTSDTLAYVLRSSPELLKKYPYHFELTISYRLTGLTVTTQYAVENTGNEELFFSIGAHPGFAFQPGEVLSDYTLEFEKPEQLERHLISEGLFTGKTEPILEGKTLHLTDEQMKKDAIVFRQMKSKTLVLRSKKSDYSLTFQANDFPYFGIWGKPGGPFVCLEPWCGRADNAGFTGDFSQKEGIESLKPNGEFIRSFSVTLP